MPLLVIYSIPEGTKCPPKVEDDLGGMVKTGSGWKYGEYGTPTVHTVQVPDNSDVTVLAKNSLKPGKCTWAPVEGQHHKRVGNQTETLCIEYRCTSAGALERTLSGRYTAKRKDQNETFPIEMSFKRNADFCLVCEIYAPRAMDHAQAFLHTKPGPGNHGILHHPGDFMNQTAPLTEGFLQGTFVGPHGEKGSLRMVLALVQPTGEMYHVHFGGFLNFAGSADIETVFTSERPVAWPSNAYA